MIARPNRDPATPECGDDERREPHACGRGRSAATAREFEETRALIRLSYAVLTKDYPREEGIVPPALKYPVYT